MSKHKNILKAIVTGFPGGGTSMLTEILRQHKKLDSGFEGGFLLVDNPSEFIDFNPFYKNLIKLWDLTPEEVAHITDTTDWNEVYYRLRELSPKIEDKDVYLFDKTPKYMTALDDVLGKVKDTKCIVIIRDPRAVFWTRFKRVHHNQKVSQSIQEWIPSAYEPALRAYLKHAEGYKRALKKFGSERIMTIQYEELCSNPLDFSKDIFAFLELEFDKNQIEFENKDERYRPIRGKGISTDYMTEYKKKLSAEIQQQINDDLADYSDLFWNA